MNNHKEYGEGFVDGFNAALKSDYIKELYQAQDKELYEKRIKELQTQMNQMMLLSYQALQYPLYSQACSIGNYYQQGLENTINAYRRY